MDEATLTEGVPLFARSANSRHLHNDVIRVRWQKELFRRGRPEEAMFLATYFTLTRTYPVICGSHFITSPTTSNRGNRNRPTNLVLEDRDAKNTLGSSVDSGGRFH